MYKLFTKDGCDKCQWVKDNCNLSLVDITELDGSVESLVELAWYECVSLAETDLPILVLDDYTKVTGAIAIKNELKRQNKKE
jgi:hypothetical protein